MGGVEDWHVGWYTSGSVWVTKDEQIDLVSVQIDVLDDWASEHLVSGHDFAFEEGALHLPKPRSYAAETDDATVTLHLGGELRPDSGGYRASRYSSLDVMNTLPLEEVVDKCVMPLKTLFELLTGCASRVTSITVQIKELRESPRRFLKLNPSLLQSTEERDATRGQMDMLTTRITLEKHGLDFSSLIRNYHSLQQSENHQTALRYLVHSQSRLLDQSADSELLTTVKAVEQFHSEAIGGTAIPVSEHDKRVEDVVQGTPTRWKTWAREVLSRSNRKGLKRQIKEVQDRAGDTGESIENVWPKFARQIAKLRSMAAHGGPTSSGDLGLRYHAGAMALRWLLRHVYLLELGVSPHEVNLMIQNTNRFKDEIQLLQQWHERISG